MMFSTLPFLVVAGAILQVCQPTPWKCSIANRYGQAQASPVSFAKDVGMTSFGPITPGGPDVTLSGTAKVNFILQCVIYYNTALQYLTQSFQSIYEQILDLNPNYNPVDFGGKPLDLDSAPTVSKKSFDTLPELEGRTAVCPHPFLMGLNYIATKVPMLICWELDRWMLPLPRSTI